MNPAPVVVVGSGPTALACCLALVDQGIRPLVIDAALNPALPSRRVSPPSIEGLPDKTIHGSDHPYRLPPGRTWSATEAVGVLPSFAAGGHSNVWGAAMLPYGDPELRGWPITTAELDPHYRAVLKHIPLSATEDALADRFPLYAAAQHSIQCDRQVGRILDRAARSAPGARMVIGRSRLAVDARAPEHGGCSACGLCMYGCPDDLIFEAGKHVRDLGLAGLVDYRPHTVVTRWRRHAEGLRVDLEGLNGERLPSIPARRLLIAAGVLSTTEIVLRSMALWGQPVRILDSQYFVAPLVSYRAEAQPIPATLAQAFIELHYGPEEWAWAHCQIYPPNHFSEAAIRKRLRRVPGHKRVARWTGQRVLPIQGFLPSRDSGYLSMILHGPSSRGPALSAHSSPRSWPAVQRCGTMLLRAHRVLGGVVATPLLEMAAVGRSFHIGGSFPMRAHHNGPDPSTDVSGRLPGEPAVHLADATTLPSIAGTTITLTAMANAHRIATLAGAQSKR